MYVADVYISAKPYVGESYQRISRQILSTHDPVIRVRILFSTKVWRVYRQCYLRCLLLFYESVRQRKM